MSAEKMYKEMGIEKSVFQFGERILKELKNRVLKRIDETAEFNQMKVIQSHAEKPGQHGTLSVLPAAMATTIWEEIHWKRCTHPYFTQRRPWCVPRLPAEPMLLAVALVRKSPSGR